MSALTATRLLRVAENTSTSTEQVAVLGRDIRTSPERIARYCVTRHEPVYEDLATLVESMAFWDRRVVRKRTKGWTRKLSLQVPVYEYGQFQRAMTLDALVEAACFLTGDQWGFEFVARKGAKWSRCPRSAPSRDEACRALQRRTGFLRSSAAFRQ
jgi:hypothetical protein